jgi:hypothetical protein
LTVVQTAGVFAAAVLVPRLGRFREIVREVAARRAAGQASET